MSVKKYITPGTKFGRLTVIEITTKNHRNEFCYSCICDCGALRNVPGVLLRNGNTKSCGCYQKDQVRNITLRHGMSRTKIHNLWIGMMCRCYTTTAHAFNHYGGRGITVCERWHKFEAFFEDMGHRPPGKSLDRIDNNGSYSPENCRWATTGEQSRNRRSNRVLEWHGEKKIFSDWAIHLGIPKRVLARRLDVLKWDVERAFSTPA